MVKFMIKFMIKILFLPLYLILGLAGVIYDIGLRAYSFVASLIYIFLFICLILAFISQQWYNIGILLLITAGAVFVTVLVGILGVFIETGKEWIQNCLEVL